MRLLVPRAQLPIFKEIVGRVVEIRSQLCHGKFWKGTGVIITPDGLILTAAHIISKNRTVQAYRWTLDARSGIMRRLGPALVAKVKHVDLRTDFALLQLTTPPPDLRGSKLMPHQRLPLDLPTYCVGFGQTKLSSGYVHGHRLHQRVNHYVASLTGGPGGSGGPVCDSFGNVIGIIVRGLVGHRLPNCAWILPVGTILSRLRRLTAKLPE